MNLFYFLQNRWIELICKIKFIIIIMHWSDDFLVFGPIQELRDDILQKIAKEMNLSETAFITEKNNHDTYSKGACSS